MMNFTYLKIYCVHMIMVNCVMLVSMITNNATLSISVLVIIVVVKQTITLNLSKAKNTQHISNHITLLSTTVTSLAITATFRTS